jgi:hypothetical protein
VHLAQSTGTFANPISQPRENIILLGRMGKAEEVADLVEFL